MHILEFTINEQILTWTNPCRVPVEKTKGWLKARFVADSEWDGMNLRAIFHHSTTPPVEVPVTSDLVDVPPECILRGYLYVGLVGLDDGGAVQITTKRMARPVVLDPATTTAGLPPESVLPEAWEKALGSIGNLSDLDTSAKNNLVAAINEVFAAAAASGGSVTPEAIAKAIEAYLKEHPIQESDPTVPDWAKRSNPPTYTAQAVGADPAGTASTAVSQHNSNNASHNDIRLLIAAINDRLNAFFDSDDSTLDELSEIVAYIKSNKALIEAVTTSKIGVADIINNLTTNVANKPLSAAQGVVLKGLIDDLTKSLSNYQPKGDYALRSELPSVPVKSVNGKTGAVQLTAKDVGAATTEELGALSAEKVTLPKDADGSPVYGTAGAKAVSDGNGGIAWEEIPSGTKSVDVSGSVEITDCVNGEMTITDFTLPENATDMVVTARKSVNIFDPELSFISSDSTMSLIKQNGKVTTKGVTITYENGVYTCNGTATGQIALGVISGFAPLWLNAGMYQFSCCPEGGSTTTYAVQWKRTDTEVTFWMDYGKGNGNPNKSFTADTPVRANIVIYSGCVCENVQFKLQILTGLSNTDTSGYTQHYPFEGSSVIINTNSNFPILGLKAFKGYTAIDVRSDASVTLRYPVIGGETVEYVSVEPQELTDDQKAQARKNIGIKEDVPMQHHDDAEFSVSVLNGSSQFSQNDITMVGDELWVSKENAAYYDNGTMIFRYKMVDGALTLVGTCDCDFGHLNTMDYCAANDCLIFGNGGNGTETTGNYFVVVKNPRSLGSTALIADVGIKYDVDIGYKVQALWGGSNLGENNIVYLLSNNAANITKVLLLKNDAGEFNGSFVTLETHELEAWGVQGADIFGDTLYIGGQLNGNEYAAVKEISLSDFTKTRVVRQKFYATDGTAVTGCVQGVYVNQDAVWICVNTGDTTKPVCLTKYRR